MRCRSASPERPRPWATGATGWRSPSAWSSPWALAPGSAWASGPERARCRAGVGIGAAGFTRAWGWAASSGPSASVRSSSDRPDRLDRSDSRSDMAAASSWAASAVPICAAAGVAAPSGTRAGPSVTTPAPTTRARPAAERRPTVRQGRERQRSVFGRVTGRALPRWRPEASRPVDGGGGVADIADHRTTVSRKSHIQVTVSYARTTGVVAPAASHIPRPGAAWGTPVRPNGAVPHGREGSRRRRTRRAGRPRG